MRIDGIEVQVKKGETILKAAKSLDIPIPTLCSLDGSEPFTSCMLCVVEDTATGKLLPACSAPAIDGMEVQTDTDSVRAARQAALELLLAEHVGDCDAPCTLACPLQIDIPEVIRLLEEGEIPEAVRRIRTATTLPGLACLLCSAPCEKACRRGKYDQSVAIGLLMRHVVEREEREASAVAPVQSSVLPRGMPPVAAQSSPKSAAVIGAGPAGLSAAYHLALLGFSCTLFEAQSFPGGSLRAPAAGDTAAGQNRQQLVDRAVAREMQILHDLGVRIELNTPVAAALSLEKIIERNDATIVAAGPDMRSVLETASVHIPEGGKATSGASRCQSSNAKVFAAGSLLKRGCSFVKALAQGKAAAACANQYVRGEAVTGARNRFQSHIGRLHEGEVEEFLKDAADIPRIVPKDAEADPQAGYNREEAVTEASRCLHCDCAAKDNCRLRVYAEQYEARGRRFRIGERRLFRRILQHPRVVFEPGKCIKCGICVRITAWEKERLGLAFLNRGYDLQVGTPFGELLSRALERSAERCVRACPTGALAFRRRSHEKPKTRRNET